jgi:hypothetical protein
VVPKKSNENWCNFSISHFVTPLKSPEKHSALSPNHTNATKYATSLISMPMKTRSILTALFLALFLAAGATTAEKPAKRITLIISPGKTIEFLTPYEKEADESYLNDIFYRLISGQHSEERNKMIDITAFIIPEEEIDDLDFDTGAIFREITEKKVSIK